MQPILALETVERFGSVALLDDRRGVSAEVVLPQDRRSSQTLAFEMDALFRRERIEPRDVRLVAVVVGPGSFTGLRVGVTTAKMFAYAVGAAVVGLGTHQVVAEQVAASYKTDETAPRPPEYLTIGVDAQRGEVVAQRWTIGPDSACEPVSEPELIAVSAWWSQAGQHGDILFAGPALERYAAQAPAGVNLVPERFWMPRALVAGRLAARQIAGGMPPDDLWSLVPVYSRLSAAEERAVRVDD